MQRWASKNGILVVNPDTSPRDIGHDFDEGYAAGFYLDATVSI
jgi:S-formylglutathione hydrolase FrmB